MLVVPAAPVLPPLVVPAVLGEPAALVVPPVPSEPAMPVVPPLLLEVPAALGLAPLPAPPAESGVLELHAGPITVENPQTAASAERRPREPMAFYRQRRAFP
jgi:hypothetical protein